MQEASEPSRNRAIRLISYLIELARLLRSKIVWTTDEYQDVLWMHTIPRDQPEYCFARAWGANDGRDEDLWMEIKKYREPVLDEVPEVCEDWVDRPTLRNTEELPELRPSISVQVEEPNPDNPDETVTVTRTLGLEDHPEVSAAWDRYVESTWLPWADLHRRWQSVQNVYAKLFQIHQEQLKLGEEYDLVLGLGLLTWRTPSGQSVKRHLVAARAALTFDAKRGKFTAGPAPDGARLAVERDTLDIAQQPSGARQIADDGLRSAEDDPWDRSALDPVLSALANSLADRGQGEYRPENLEPSRTGDPSNPVVDYAPALILRKRSTLQVEEKLQKILEQVQAGEKIAPLFWDICEIPVRGGQTPENRDPGPRLPPDTDPEIYFPKPANDQQLQIVRKLRSADGVLVQGPPGTGKSHTIANLICHLLAKGQRVLVTAKTPRALQVLHGQLPKEIQPLCVSLLGSGMEEQKSLRESVDKILAEPDRRDQGGVDREARTLEESLHRLKSEKAEIEYRIRSIREADTRPQSVIDGAYRGTAGEIAGRLEKESAEFGWLQDKVPYDREAPVSPDELTALRAGLSALTPELEAELQLAVPGPHDLPSIETFADLIRRYRDLERSYSGMRPLLDFPQARALGAADIGVVRGLAEELAAFKKAVESVRRKPFSWTGETARDVLSGNGGRWTELHRVLSETLPGLGERARKIDAQTLSVPENRDRKKLLQDAKIIQQHFAGGGKLKRFCFFYPSIIRERGYVVESVRIDGVPCGSPATLSALIEYLSVQGAVDYAWKLWEGKAAIKLEKSTVLQVAELEELQRALKDTIELDLPLATARKTLGLVQNISEPAWHDPEAVGGLLSACEAVICRNDFATVNGQLRQLSETLGSLANRPNAHPLAGEILAAVKRGDIKSYPGLLARISDLRGRSNQAKQTRDALKRIEECAPKFARQLSENPNGEEWGGRINAFEKAWAWARAHSWISDFLNKEDLPSLERRVKQIDEDIKKRLAELSAARAWKFCLDRMTEPHRSYLDAWRVNMEEGKGGGKKARRARRQAQKHFNKCREAVPAWVMPLHRVYETADPSPGMFDAVIVDEASQCGQEALPLMYMAKQLIVVGDDQQISPEAVGVEVEPIFRLQDEYLEDFEHRDAFNIDRSLFDHAQRRFGNRIVLREHFRCVPEIIRFSNDLCYSANPLIPLRQYPPQRLEPLKKIHVPDGYREGDGARAINRREAEEIVKAIVECCADERYEGKTMGVIGLQGDAQAYLIQDMLLKRLGAEEMEKRRLICGNPYSFQGDERDVIFLSLVAAPNQRIGALAKAEDKRRFNVAASRARDQMWLFHTATLNDLSESCMRRRLLEYFENPVSQITRALGAEAEKLQRLAATANRQIVRPPSPYESWFELDVALAIAGRGYRVVPQYPVVENKMIDLVIEGTEARLAVECDGDFWHGPEQYEKDMERQRMLERCGWVFHRIRECAFYANRDGALANLVRELERMGIQPAARTVSTVPSVREENRVEIGDTVAYAEEDSLDIERQASIIHGPSNPELGTINCDTPVARALLGARVNDVVEVMLPEGSKMLYVKKIRKSDAG